MLFKIALAVSLLTSALFLSACGSNDEGHVPALTKATVRTSITPESADVWSKLIAEDGLPIFPNTPVELKGQVNAAVASAEAQIAEIGRIPPAKLNFENTVVAIDNLTNAVETAGGIAYLIANTSTIEELRAAADEQVTRIMAWMIGVEYNETLYQALKNYRETKQDHIKALAGPEAKLLTDTWDDFRRAGMDLDPAKRKQLQEMRTRLEALGVVFDTNIRNAAMKLTFTAEDLEGLSEDLMREYQVDYEGKPTDTGFYTVNAMITSQFLGVTENAKKEETRKILERARSSAAMDKNLPVLQEMLVLRSRIAKILEYKSWADYQLEKRMAKTGEGARKLLVEIRKNIQPKFESELEEIRALKVKDTGNPQAKLALWDFRYYENQLKKTKYQVDTESLRVFFELNRVQRGVFGVYEQIFGLKIDEMKPRDKWADEVKLFSVRDQESREVLGYFYLDPFKRAGKFTHFANFGIISTSKSPEGIRRKPVCALVGNFPSPTPDKPSLLRPKDVVTFFHEFGHVMHSILNQSRYARQSEVERDFVEAPSQTLEAWGLDKTVLDLFAEDYRSPGTKINPATLARIKEVDVATKASHYRGQIVYGLTDLDLHSPDGAEKLARRIASRNSAETFLPRPDETDFTAGWGHLNGYDAGYYSYAWSDVISQDLLTAFQSSPRGLLDPNMGRKLRKEIYEAGGSRLAEESIRAFLGRDISKIPFYKSVGVDSATTQRKDG